MLRCKCCNKSDLGVNLIRTTKDPVRLLDGEITAVLGEQEVIEEIDYCFCNVCKKAITKDDLYEYVECPVCGKQVNELIDEKCSTCNEVSKKMESFSKDDLIQMLIKQQVQIDQILNKISGNDLSNTPKKENNKTKEVNEEKKTKKEPVKKLDVESQKPKPKIELDDNEDILLKIENLETEGLDFDDYDEIEID